MKKILQLTFLINTFLAAQENNTKVLNAEIEEVITKGNILYADQVNALKTPVPVLDDKGKEEFLKIEEKALMSIDFNKTVLATGGSAIFSELAMNYIREKSSVIFIDVTFNQIRNRISDLSKRGFLKKPNQTFRDAFTEREFFYKKYSDYEVQNNSTIEKCMDNIFLIINQKP